MCSGPWEGSEPSRQCWKSLTWIFLAKPEPFKLHEDVCEFAHPMTFKLAQDMNVQGTTKNTKFSLGFTTDNL